MKLAAPYYSGLFVSVSRFAIGAVLCVLVLFRRYGGIRPVKPGLVALRGILGAGSMAAGYAAISLTGPGRAILLTNTYPLFVAVFGALFFGERLEAKTLGSLAICTAGAFLVVRDGSGAALAGDLAALASSVLAGLAVNVVRKATRFENPFTLYLSPCLFGLPLAFLAKAPASSGGLPGLLLLAAVGCLAFVAQALMAYGYRSVTASRGSVVFYLETALTVALGAAFAGERFTGRFAAGLAVIIAGLVLNSVRARPAKAR